MNLIAVAALVNDSVLFFVYSQITKIMSMDSYSVTAGNNDLEFLFLPHFSLLFVPSLALAILFFYFHFQIKNIQPNHLK